METCVSSSYIPPEANHFASFADPDQRIEIISTNGLEAGRSGHSESYLDSNPEHGSDTKENTAILPESSDIKVHPTSKPIPKNSHSTATFTKPKKQSLGLSDFQTGQTTDASPDSSSPSLNDSGFGSSMTQSSANPPILRVNNENERREEGKGRRQSVRRSYAESTGDEGDDLLDLDNFDDDDESWLYGSQGSEEGGDVMEWIRVAADSLEPRAKHSLIQKLDAIARKKEAAKIGGEVRRTLSDPHSPSATCDSLLLNEDDDLLSGILEDSPTPGPPKEKMQNNLGTFKIDRPQKKMVTLVSPPISELNTPDFVIAEEAIMGGKGDGRPSFPQPPSDPSLNQPAPRSISVPTGGDAEEGRVTDQSSLSRSRSNDSSVDPSGTSVNSRTRESSPRLDKANLEDIQLLASMQEEDLRQCLEKMNMERRRRTSSSNNSNPSEHQNLKRNITQDNEQIMVALSQAQNAEEFFRGHQQLSPSPGRGTTPARNPSPTPYFHQQTTAQKKAVRQNREKFQTFRKQGPPSRGAPVVQGSGYGRPEVQTPRSGVGHRGNQHLLQPASEHRTPARVGLASRSVGQPERRATGPLPSSEINGRNLGFTRTASPQPYEELSPNSVNQQAGGFQKSLPNLPTSHSTEFSLPPDNPRVEESSSEKGSYGNLPGKLSPAGSNSQIGLEKPRTSMLRQPTPRGVGAMASKSGIPMPRTGIPRPGSARPKSPGRANGPHSILRPTDNSQAKAKKPQPGPPQNGGGHLGQNGNTWNDGCF